MPVDLELAPKHKRPAGEPCCEPVVYPDVERRAAERLATLAKALGDPIRLQLVDVLRKHAGKVCVCELVPLFELSQPTVSHHLKVLREAGIVGSERRGLWAYYYVNPEALAGAERMAERIRPTTRFARRCASATPKPRARCHAERAGCCGPAESSCGCGTGTRRTPAGAARSAPSSIRARSATRCLTPRSLRRWAVETRRPCAELHDGDVVLDLGSGRRDRRSPLGSPGWPRRQGLRSRHDRRDAGARPPQPAPGRGARTSSSSRARSRRSRCPANRLTWSSQTA